jgi:hypothetical protein
MCLCLEAQIWHPNTGSIGMEPNMKPTHARQALYHWDTPPSQLLFKNTCLKLGQQNTGS